MARRSVAGVGGLALFAGVLLVSGMVASEPKVRADPSVTQFRLLPVGSPGQAGSLPAVAATPVSIAAAPAAVGEAGVWSTPAEFAPPE